jgi:hypothetical protein
MQQWIHKDKMHIKWFQHRKHGASVSGPVLQ